MHPAFAGFVWIGLTEPTEQKWEMCTMMSKRLLLIMVLPFVSQEIGRLISS
jgi:hypothetical protein